MNKKQAFAIFGLIQTNERWSWSAKSHDGKTVSITVWADQINKNPDIVMFVDTFNLPHNQRNELWRDAKGNRERIKHLSHARKHLDGLVRVLMVHAVDAGAYPRQVKANSVEPITNCFFRVVELNERTGEFKLERLEQS